MDGFQMIFDAHEGGEGMLASPDFDYGTFLQSGDTAMGDSGLVAPLDDNDYDLSLSDDMPYMGDEEISTAAAAAAAALVPFHSNGQNMQYYSGEAGAVPRIITTSAVMAAEETASGSSGGSGSGSASPDRTLSVTTRRSPTTTTTISRTSTTSSLDQSNGWLQPLPQRNHSNNSNSNSNSNDKSNKSNAHTAKNGSAAARYSASPYSHYSNSSSALDKRSERRGHRKSRMGCYNCKRRRIKCQETRPACGHCIKTGLSCEYPALHPINHQPQHQIPLFSLQDMRFFQHFLLNCCPHHPLGNQTLWTHEIPCLSHKYDFLMHALLGLAASDLMPQDPGLAAAAMDHRLRAIRAIKRSLAAVSRRPVPVLCEPADSAVVDPADGSRKACTARKGQKGQRGRRGRGSSVSGSQSQSRSRSGSSPDCAASGGGGGDGWCAGNNNNNNNNNEDAGDIFAEGNALVATCFALTFQSVALDDGMVEYMTFIRGILLVAIQMYMRGSRLIFRNMLGPSASTDMVRPVLEPMPAIERAWAEAALAAVQALAPLCCNSGGNSLNRGSKTMETNYSLILAMAEALFESPLKAYTAMTQHYAWWMQLPQSEFCLIIDVENNPVCVLLASHWIAIKQVMARVTGVERLCDDRPDAEARREEERKRQQQKSGGGGDGMDPGIVRWLKHLNRMVPPAYAVYNQWPVWVEAELERDPRAFGQE